MKKLLAILMAVCLLAGTVDLNAFAVEMDSEQAQTEENNESVKDSVTSGDILSSDEESTTPGEDELIVIDEELPELLQGSGDPEVTRVQWLHELTTLFEMSVAEDNYPDNYYSDMTTSSPYYYDVMLATEFGLIDTEAGDAFHPEDAATREFAAHTLNMCLGYANDDQTYTFSEAEAVTYADDIQVAINRGWFVLSAGSFQPTKPITVAEKENMLADAQAVLDSEKIDENYSNTVQLKPDVIEIPEGTVMELPEENLLVIYDSPIPITQGVKFAVYEDGFPVVLRADDVSVTGNETHVRISSVDTNEAYEQLDVQGCTEVDLAKLQPVDENAQMLYIVGGTEEQDWEDGTKYETLEEVGEQEISAVEIIQECELPVLGASEKPEKFNLKVKVTDVKGEKNFNLSEVYLAVSAKVSVQASITDKIIKDLGIKDELNEYSLFTIPVGLLGLSGRITTTVEPKLSGAMTLNYTGKLKMGVQWSQNDSFRMIKSFQKESFTISVKGEASLAVKLAYKTNWLILKGSIYAELGGRAEFETKSYTDGKSPTNCMHVGAWLYYTEGAKVSLDVGFFKAEWVNENEIWDETNSPARVYYHFEDGKAVEKCSRKNESDSTGSGGNPSGGGTGESEYRSSWYYYTPVNSQYGFNGVNTVTTDEGTEYKYFDYSLDKDGNATITGYNGNVSALDIPAELDGHPVVAIGYRALKNNSKLRIINIPDSVTKIDDEAFYGCNNLTSVMLSENLTYIGYKAFCNCDDDISMGNMADDYFVNKQYKKGDIVCFGHTGYGSSTYLPDSIHEKLSGKKAGFYELNNQLYRFNGESAFMTIPIRWIVLEDQGDSLLLISEYILTSSAFSQEIDGADVSWENSEIRKYINSDKYLNSFFDEDEKKDIITSQVMTRGILTQDKLYVPSYEELNTYFDSEDELIAHYYEKLVPSVTTPISGFGDSIAYDKVNYSCAYWTRNADKLNYGMSQPTYVGCDGIARAGGRVYCTWNMGVRPMIKIKKTADCYNAPSDIPEVFDKDFLAVPDGENLINISEELQKTGLMVRLYRESKGQRYTSNAYFLVGNSTTFAVGENHVKAIIFGLYPQAVEREMTVIGYPHQETIQAQIINWVSENPQVRLSWPGLNNSGGGYYAVYRSEVSQDDFELIYSGEVSSGYYSDTGYSFTYTYTDKTVENGKKYKYKIKGLYAIYDREVLEMKTEEIMRGYEGELSNIAVASTGNSVMEEVSTPTNPFVDVAEGNYYYDSVLWAVNHNPQITNGTSATTFNPQATCTRGQVVTFLWRAAGCPEPTGSTNPFTDVAADAYYYKAVQWAVEKGITNGTGATTFSPGKPCTRGQVVTFLYRFENMPSFGSTTNPFADVKEGAYYYDAVLWAVNHTPQITNGTSATTFNPEATCTRGQIVTFLYRDLGGK